MPMPTKVTSLQNTITFCVKLSFKNNFGTNTEIGQGLGRILGCGARKPEQT